MRSRTEWAWWEASLAGRLLMFVVALIVGEWVLAGLAAFAAAYAGLVMTIKYRRSRGGP
ncbi:MAG TPA: hypothetical protein VKO84_12435 [Gaiellaceae bacterium]|nr:hypothetical protein [Gaiellaceae bacterium]